MKSKIQMSKITEMYDTICEVMLNFAVFTQKYNGMFHRETISLQKPICSVIGFDD